MLPLTCPAVNQDLVLKRRLLARSMPILHPWDNRERIFPEISPFKLLLPLLATPFPLPLV